MKSKLTSGICLAILGVLISIVPNFLIGKHCLNMGMKCLWIAKTEFAIGILIIILALFLIYFESKETKLGISLSITLIGILSALISTVIIGFCNGSCSSDCICNPYSSLILTILGVSVALIAFVNFIILSKR